MKITSENKGVPVFKGAGSQARNESIDISSILVLIFSSIAVSAVLSLSIDSPITYWLVCFLVLAICTFLNVSQIMLLSFSFWVFLPIEYISNNPAQNFFNLPSLLLLVFLIRSRAKLSINEILFMGAVSAFLMAATFTSINQFRSVGWSFQLVLLLVVAISVSRAASRIDSKYLFAGIAVGTLLVSLLAIFEFAVGKTAVFDGQTLPAYEDSYKWINYSVFRITTTLGHPLNNGLFFGTIALLFIFKPGSMQKHLLIRAATVFSILGLLLSSSRTAILALLVGLVLFVALRWSSLGVGSKIWFTLLSPIIIFTAIQTPFLGNVFLRLESGEAISSQAYRFDLFQWLDYLLKEYLWIGSGPGTSGYVWSGIGNTAPLENGFIQLCISLGFVPAVVLLMLCFSLLIYVNRRRIAAFVPTIILLTYIPAMNFVDDSSGFFAFFSIAMVLISLEGSEIRK